MCPGDVDLDGQVRVDDLLAILSDWGECLECPSDITDDGIVDVDDLLLVLGAWGPCP